MTTPLRTFSQKGTNQDLWVDRVLNHLEGGYFVDVGAHAGRKLSNSFALERQRGWQGICIEASDEPFSRLVKTRPSVRCVQACVSDTAGETVQFIHAQEYGGMKRHLQQMHRRRWGGRKPVTEVVTRTLLEILDECDATDVIDYLSIDTEGTELKILKGLKFPDCKYRFRTCTIEHNFDDKYKAAIVAEMAKGGYSYEGDRAQDAFFVCPELKGCGIELGVENAT